jgi:hypothetical protein
MGTQGRNGLRKARLPQRRQIQQSLDQDERAELLRLLPAVKSAFGPLQKTMLPRALVDGTAIQTVGFFEGKRQAAKEIITPRTFSMPAARRSAE